MKNKFNKALKFLKEHKKARVFSIAIISVLSLFFLINFGRYIKDIITNYITRTQIFYFNSDKLTEDNKEFEINYWPGVGSYPIYINVNSLDNNLRGAPMPIDYTITCTSDTGLRCDLSKNAGTIGTATNSDSFTVTAVATQPFSDGDEVSLQVKVKASEPYEKELSAVFRFVVGNYGISYKIEDQVGQPYLTAVISNTIDYYTVIDDFGTYHEDDTLTADEYEALDPADQVHCASALVTLAFDPNVVRLDMTNYYYQHKRSELLQTIGGYDYVKSFTFRVKAQTSVAIKFYKLFTTNNYTYPIINNTPVVQFSAR